MYSCVKSYGISGIDAYAVTVETTLTRAMPAFDIVGLPDAAVKESRSRVQSALTHAGYQLPVSKITVNLAVAIAILAMTVTFVVTMILSTQIFNSTVSSVRQKQVMYNNIAEIDKAVRANYYGEINDTTLYDMMGAGYMAGIGDANAVYYTAAQYTEYKGIHSGQVVGVGVDVVKDATTGNARVVRVYAGIPTILKDA